ncbi:MAG TPA: glucoamylase family protein, partial [Chitinophagaceae bacterium]|nr:glucoamylase family protein [Chitinophagaceae bacterium]
MEADIKMLEILQSQAFTYFLKFLNPKNGLIADKSKPDSHSSIAAVGLGISSYVVGVERNLLSREDAINKILTVLNFFHDGQQGPEVNAMGYKGFYYHFLHMDTGRRAWESELSTIDTAIFIAGALTAANYFKGINKEEKEIRDLAESLYKRIDWRWALNNGIMICHGWKPESGFLNYYWDEGYSEAIILYVLALGSPTFAIDPIGYRNWTSSFKWENIDGVEYIHAGPLFIHQMSHLWLDFQSIQDDLNRKYKIDYFENSRRATYIQQQYAIKNPLNFKHYGENNWGFTASDGPGPARIMI